MAKPLTDADAKQYGDALRSLAQGVAAAADNFGREIADLPGENPTGIDDGKWSVLWRQFRVIAANIDVIGKRCDWDVRGLEEVATRAVGIAAFHITEEFAADWERTAIRGFTYAYAVAHAPTKLAAVNGDDVDVFDAQIAAVNAAVADANAAIAAAVDAGMDAQVAAVDGANAAVDAIHAAAAAATVDVPAASEYLNAER